MYTTGSATSSPIRSKVYTPSCTITSLTGNPAFVSDIWARSGLVMPPISAASCTVITPRPAVPASAFTTT